MAINTTIQAINNAVPNVGLDTPHPEEPTRKLLNAILRDYLQALESLENDTVTKSQIVQVFGDSQTAVISQDALTDYLSNLSFLQLADTPYVYAGSIGKFIRVNSAGDGLEFFELGAAAISNSFNDLEDKPDFDSIPQVITAADFASLPATGDVTKTYLTLDDGKLYYWSGSAYVVFTNDTATWAGIGGNIGDNAALTAALNDKADAADVALKSTSIYAGAGLIGGGDLSDDRTLNVDIGTGAGQVMAGDDSRVTGLEDGAYAQIGIDIAPLGLDGLVPPANLPAQFSGDYDDLTNKPTLFSGAYDDLSGRPALGTVAPLNVDTDATLAANSDSLIPSQKAVKAYVDNNAGGDVTAAGNNVFTGSNTFSDLGGAQYGGTLSTPLGPIPVFRNISFTSGNGSVDVNLADIQGILGYEFLKDVFAADFSQLEEDDVITVMLSKFHDWDDERVVYSDYVQASNTDGDIRLSKNIYLEIDGIALAEFSLVVGDDGTSMAGLHAKEVHGLESRVGTFPLAFDIERTYGSKETPLTGNLGWTKSHNDKRVYQEVYHNDATAPTELASMTKVGDGVYVPSETNLIYIWCSLPNATTTADGYFYTVTQV